MMVAIVVFMFSIGSAHLEMFDPQKMLLVDHSRSNYGSNYLFRSNNVLTQTSSGKYIFNCTAIIQRARQLGNIPSNYTINFNVISLLNPGVPDDRLTLDIERSSANCDIPEVSSFYFYNWILTGDWTTDYIVPRVDHLTRLMSIENAPNKNTVILVHCMQGLDRTGELIGSYVLHKHSACVPNLTGNLLNRVLCDFAVNDTRIGCRPSPKRRNFGVLKQYTEYLINRC